MQKDSSDEGEEDPGFTVLVQRSGMENVRILWLTKEKLDTSSEWIQIFYTYGKMQESGLLEIIPLIIT